MVYNIQIFRFLNSFVFEDPLLDKLLVFGAQHLVFVVSALALSLFILSDKYGGAHILFAFVVVISAWLAAEGLKVLFGTLRPYAVLEGVKLLFQSPPESFAFPSGHAAFMFSGAFVVWLFEKKWGIFFTFCALIVGVCRVVSGIHWPLDILGGALLGAVVFLIIYEIAINRRPELFLKN